MNLMIHSKINEKRGAQRLPLTLDAQRSTHDARRSMHFNRRLSMKLLLTLAAIILIAGIAIAQEPPQRPVPPIPPPMLEQTSSAPEPPDKPAPPLTPVPEDRKEAHVPPELETQALAYVKEMSPSKYERLSKLKIIRPLEYKENILRIIEEKMRMDEIKIVDPERFEQILRQQKLDQKSWQLAEKYKGADAKSKETIKKELVSTLNELFDLKEADKIREIARLENELKKLKDMIDSRNKNRERIIDKRFNEMMGQPEYLEW